MDFTAIENQIEREMARLKTKKSNSERMGLFSSYSCEMGSLSTKLRLGMAFEEQCDDEMGLPSRIRNNNRGAKRAVTEPIPWLDLSAVGSCSNSMNLFPNQSGFGSPIEVVDGFEHTTSSADVQDGCSGLVTSFRPAASTIQGKQLTIFYNGTVNVYDDIPEDKAQAIILMASSGNYSSYPHTKVQNGCGSLRTDQKASVPVMKLSNGSDIRIQTASPKLEAARKHSRQRFMEKRKDRVNAMAMYPYKIDKADNQSLNNIHLHHLHWT